MRQLQQTTQSVAAMSDKRRRSNIISLSHISSIDDDAQRTLVDFEVYLEVSAWLAWYNHIATGSSCLDVALLPEVHTRLATCDVDFEFMMRDTQFSAINAARQLLDAYSNVLLDEMTNTSYVSNPTTSLVGTVRSMESSSMSFLSSAYNIPQIASSSTASYLNNKDLYPLFARTVPTNQGDAYAMVLYLKELNVSHVGIFYIADGYGNDFHADVVRELVASNITVLSVQYEDSAMETAIQEFATSNLKYVIAILNPGTWRNFIRYAYQYQIIGRSDYFWMFGESSLEFADPSFRLDHVTEKDLATAIHGSAIISATEPLNELFDQVLTTFSKNTTLQQQYINQHSDPFIFENYTFSTPGPSLYQYLTYDAVLALMLATCDVQQANEDLEVWDPRTAGHSLYEQLIRTEFQGLSGYVAFDPITGTRQAQNLIYGVRNVLLVSRNSSDEDFKFTSEMTSFVNLEDKQIEYQVPFVYFSNTTTPPLPLPPVEMQLNLIPTAILAFGWALCGFVIFVSIFWIIWTLRYRNKDVVKAAQPIFLCQICIGTLIIASAIIPMSLQEPISKRGLDIACMATPWLISMGFVTTFSALFTKTWRLNKLFQNSRNMRRVVIRPRHVILPLIVIMMINFIVMLAWTIDAPQIWQRIGVTNYDKFGRSIETFGHCEPSNRRRSKLYLSVIVAIDLSLLVFSNYQAYLARALPSEFSESSHIAIAMASMLEICILVIPLLFLKSTDPSIDFVIRSLMASVTSLSILIPIFLPKFIRLNSRQRFSATHGMSPRRSKIYISGVQTGIREDSSDLNRFESGVAQVEDGTPMPSPPKNQTGSIKVFRNESYFEERQAASSKASRNESYLEERQAAISENVITKSAKPVTRSTISAS